MYFKNFDNLIYDLTIKTDKEQNVHIIPDLTTRVSTYYRPKDLEVICNVYMINNNETPEQIAYKIYKDPLLHWTILYINEISDVYSEWPLTESKLVEYCQDKYGSSLYDTRWTVKIPEQIVMDRPLIEELYGMDYAIDVTNWDYEVDKNEQKRFIKVIKPEYIGTFVSQFMSNLTK